VTVLLVRNGRFPRSAGLRRGLAKTCGLLLNCQQEAAGPRKMRVALRYICSPSPKALNACAACYVTESERGRLVQFRVDRPGREWQLQWR
jgi:hypothetical protein